MTVLFPCKSMIEKFIELICKSEQITNSCYVKNMNGLDRALNPNLNLPLTLKKIKVKSMIKIKNACINKDCVR